MNPNLASKLSLAVSQTVNPLVPKSFSAPTAPKNVAKCRDLSHKSQFEKTNPKPLSARQRTAITLLYQGHTVANAARILNMNPRTLFRWLKQPRFQSAMSQSVPQVELPPSRIALIKAEAYERALRSFEKSLGMSRNVADFAIQQNEPKNPAPPRPVTQILHPQTTQLNFPAPNK